MGAFASWAAADLHAADLHAADAARREKRQRLGALVRGGGDDFAGSIAREYATQRSSGGGKRDVRDAADYMKKDSNF